MVSCGCDNPTSFRATSENNGGSYLYLRCADCGGKAGCVSVDEKDMRDHITDPENAQEDVSIRFDRNDSYFYQNQTSDEYDDEVSELYGKRRIREENYWVYVLDCRDRFYYDNYQELKRRAEKRLQREPDWLRMAWEHRRVVYVGQTENLFKRMGEHFEQNRTTEFTKLFEPSGINYLEPAHNRRRAERREEEIGKNYYDSDSTFSYWK